MDHFSSVVDMKTVLVDNQKAAVLKNNNGKVVFNSGFLLLADHYNFLPRACRPRRARTKGKVERMVKYLKENFFVRYRRFDSFTHVNQQLEQWIADVADKRELRQFKETPEQRFALEQEHLQPLPDTDFDTGFAPIFPDICYHLTHYKPAAADIPVASDNPAHYADAIRYNARTPLQGSLLPLTRLVWA